MNSDAVQSLFRREFGGRATHMASAPGRTNLIGEHTDYNDGFVFPAAINRRVWVAARVCGTETRLRSAQRGRTNSFNVATTTPGSESGWGKYVAAVAWSLTKKAKKPLPNIEAAIISDLPIGAGVSSSAALEMAFACLWNEICDLKLSSRELALVAQHAENDFVGLECGIMDQMASAIGKSNCAFLLDTRTLTSEFVELDPELSLLICDTRKPRNLTKTAYNERRQECEAAASVMSVPKLRDANLQLLLQFESKLSEMQFKRARHVITENDRALQFLDALKNHEYDQVSQLMEQSHSSLRDDYEVSCIELDIMADAARRQPGCLGARMTGAGFGGACIALVQSNSAMSFCQSVQDMYHAATGIEPEFQICRADDGAFASFV